MGPHSETDVAIIGAGPYGLSLAAHLAAREVRFRIFGRPMETWRENMPEGMFLKSPARASNLSDPWATHTLARFCALTGQPYGDWDWPVPLETFARYGEWFQASLVPAVEPQDVAACTRAADGFQLQLQDGDTVKAGSVVVSSGYSQSARMPEEFAGLPPHAASHSSVHRSHKSFRGKEVIVVGAGQSALESAALLKEAGASPLLLARRHHLEWNPRPVLRRTPYQALRHPRTGLGVGLRYAFYEHPFLPFYYLPQAMRHEQVDRVLGPAGAWWLRERVVDQLPSMLGCKVREASLRSDRPTLVVERDGRTEELRADHLIAATGYRVGPESFPCLSPDLKSALRWDRGSPVLSRRFESTASGLYFIGLASARSFGPVMRFVDGAQVTAPRLGRHLAGRYGRSGTRGS